MKKLLVLIMGMVPFSAYCEVASESLCFESSGGGKIKFELRTYSDVSAHWFGGFVKYINSKQPISLVLKTVEREELDSQAPVQLTRTWSEVLEGKITGEYEMISQGGNIVSMTYKKNNGKEYSFGFDSTVGVSGDGGCEWEN